MVIDLHSHVLPGIDDGSASIAESVAMLQMEAEQGIETVVATPHFYANHDELDRFLLKRDAAAAELADALRSQENIPQIKLGAEVYFFPGMSSSETLKSLTIDGKGCILIEMPPPPWTDQMYRELVQIRENQDLIPVIAHVDRYIGRFRTYGIPERLEELPVYVQANASFFLNRRTAAMAMRMLRKRQIQLLGSDCHNLHERKPRLGMAVRAIEQALGRTVLEEIAEYQDAIFNP